jgi:hypothetical protein
LSARQWKIVIVTENIRKHGFTRLEGPVPYAKYLLSYTRTLKYIDCVGKLSGESLSISMALRELFETNKEYVNAVVARSTKTFCNLLCLISGLEVYSPIDATAQSFYARYKNPLVLVNFTGLKNRGNWETLET